MQRGRSNQVISKTNKMKNQPLKDIEKALMYEISFSLGILPIENVHADMSRALKDLSPEEARAFKRKFRKVWKKTFKQMVAQHQKLYGKKHAAAFVKRMNDVVGLGKKNPTKNEKIARKNFVSREIFSVISPAVTAFEKIKRNEGKEGPKEE